MGGGAAIYTFQPEGLQEQGFVSLAPGIWCVVLNKYVDE